MQTRHQRGINGGDTIKELCNRWSDGSYNTLIKSMDELRVAKRNRPYIKPSMFLLNLYLGIGEEYWAEAEGL